MFDNDFEYENTSLDREIFKSDSFQRNLTYEYVTSDENLCLSGTLHNIMNDYIEYVPVDLYSQEEEYIMIQDAYDPNGLYQMEQAELEAERVNALTLLEQAMWPNGRGVVDWSSIVNYVNEAPINEPPLAIDHGGATEDAVYVGARDDDYVPLYEPSTLPLVEYGDVLRYNNVDQNQLVFRDNLYLNFLEDNLGIYDFNITDSAIFPYSLMDNLGNMVSVIPVPTTEEYESLAWFNDGYQDIIDTSESVSDDYYSIDWFNDGYNEVYENQQPTTDIFDEEELGIELLFSS